MFSFELPKHIALKMIIKSTYVLKKTSSNFSQPQFQTGPTKNLKIDEEHEKLQHFGPKNP